MGSIARERQADRFIAAFGEFILEQNQGMLGKSFVVEEISLDYDEYSSEVRLAYQLKSEDGQTYEFKDESVYFTSDGEDLASVKATVDLMKDGTDLDAKLDAAVEIYDVWEQQCLDPEDLPSLKRGNVLRIKSKMEEANLLMKPCA